MNVRLNLFVLAFSAIIVAHAVSLEKRFTMPSIDDYVVSEVSRSQYRYANNWSELSNNGGHLMIAYKEVTLSQTPVIIDIIYYIDTGREKIFVGEASKRNGIIDSTGNEFLIDKNLRSNADFFKNFLVGFSRNSVENPFFITGIGRQTDNGKLYKTEVLARLMIDSRSKSLVEFRSVY